MRNLEKIKELLKLNNTRLKKKYNLNEIGIFGSVVRGEDTDLSDVDILIDYDKNKGMTLFDLIRLEDELSVLIGSKVEIALKNKLKPVIGKYILKEVIYI